MYKTFLVRVNKQFAGCPWIMGEKFKDGVSVAPLTKDSLAYKRMVAMGELIAEEIPYLDEKDKRIAELEAIIADLKK